jgi:phosphoglycerate dehydrogenase-like enzyme
MSKSKIVPPTPETKREAALSEFDNVNPSASGRPKAVFLLGGESYDLIYPETIRGELERYVDFVAEPIFTEDLDQRLDDLKEVEAIFSGWNAPQMDEALLQRLPNLKVVFYGAGSVRYWTTDAFWARGIRVTSANAANAVPVSEYTLGTILLSLKQFWAYSRIAKQGKGYGDHTRPVSGAYRTNVGLISFGLIARRTAELLRPFDLNLHVYCPFLTEAEAEAFGVTRCALAEIFESCHVVSLHTPNLPETRGMIQKEHFARMRPHATFINSARGAVVNETDLIEVAEARPDLSFLLDVTDPEPPEADSKLLSLPNVILSPHIAGSMGPEIGRLGEYMLDEVKRYVSGQPLQWEISREEAMKMA